MALNTEREAEIDIGVNYPFSKLDKGEVLLSREAFETLDKEIGDSVELRFNHPEFWDALRSIFNEYAEQNGLSIISENVSGST